MKINDFVLIKQFKDDETNREGCITAVGKAAGRKLYHVSNMNMPFMGSINAWFERHELEPME